MEESVQRRLGANQALFREVNEGIERGVWPGDEQDPVHFRCECARMGCTESIALPIRDYERVRQHPRQFMVVPGHEAPSVELVVESHPDYVVAKKRSEAGIVAEDTDPRR
jgi:hypothetical protein